MRSVINLLAVGARMASPVAASAENTRAAQSLPVVDARAVPALPAATGLSDRESRPVARGSEFAGAPVWVFVFGGIAATLGVIAAAGGFDGDGDVSPGT